MFVVARQIWALTVKTLLQTAVRKPISTAFRALIFPLAIVFIVSWSQYFFNPPQQYGIGSPSPVLDLADALSQGGVRNTVAFVDNGLTGGDISAVIDGLTQTIQGAGKTVQVLPSENDLRSLCRLKQGASPCFGAIVWRSSPSEPTEGGFWNYTMKADSTLGSSVDISKSNNDAQRFLLPLQKAVDTEIVKRSPATNHTAPPAAVYQFPFTTELEETRAKNAKADFMETGTWIFGILYFISMAGLIYHLSGVVAAERELGMSSLIDAMVPSTSTWYPNILRLASNHLAFTIVYLPSWLVTGIVLATKVFTLSPAAISIFYHLLFGLSLVSYTLLGASFFRRTQLSGVLPIITAMALVLIPPFLDGKSQTPATVIAMSLLFPPSNYAFFISSMARWEAINSSTNLSQSPPTSPWSVSGMVFWIFMIVQILVYPVLAITLERLLWGTTSKARKLTVDKTYGSTVQVNNFSKTYKPNWIKRLFSKKCDVHAVKDLNMSARRGEILCLLGKNGSGKSSTLDAIAGLNRITSGEIQIDGARGIGIAPQKNVLWNDLTVKEHVKIYNSLKAVAAKDSQARIDALLHSCDLTNKVNAKAKTLSGGQKRKLQLALMFSGGSSICCVDEVSSGLDPVSRRKIWDILLNERGHRTIILTTHFLDEADFLADQIVILDQGSLKAEGSAAELKTQLGDGYRVMVPKSSRHAHGPSFEGIDKVEALDQTIYSAPDSASATMLVTRLEKIGISPNVSGPTIEQLFLKLAEDRPEKKSVSSDSAPERSQSAEGEDEYAATVVRGGNAINLQTGKHVSAFQQGWWLWRKRLTILRRNYMPYIAAIAVVIIGSAVCPLLLRSELFSELECPNPNGTQSQSYYYSYEQSFAETYGNNLVLGPSSIFNNESLTRIANLYSEEHASYGGWISDFDTLYRAVQFVEAREEFDSVISGQYDTLRPGGIFLGDDPTFAWRVSTISIVDPIFVQNILDSISSGVDIFVSYSDADSPIRFQLLGFIAICVCVLLGFVFSVYPAFFALYPTLERLRQVRRLEYSNGVRPGSLWLAYMSFDFPVVLLVSVISVVLLYTANMHAWFQLGHLFVVFILYGVSSMLLSYNISMCAPSPLAAWAFSAGGQVLLLMAYLGGAIGIQANVEIPDLQGTLNIMQFTVALISPVANLLRSLFIALSQLTLNCGDPKPAGDITKYGGPILYLILQSLALFGSLLWWDSGINPFTLLFRRKVAVQELEGVAASKSGEFAAEIARVENSNSGLGVLHLTKSFGKNKAVDDVTFGVNPGELFALLGPNGAGKTTTISLIRGDIPPSTSGSQISVHGTSMLRQRATARAQLGVCPQFDTSDRLTITENLTFYARIRGIADPSHNVTQLIRACGLEPWAKTLAQNLSGGTKRKLSLAIALVGNPAVLLLDEPSSGLDPKSKRVLWSTLAQVSADRAVVLTTHSMEEADALADRAGIMSSRMLALGSCDELRRRDGDVYHVHLTLASAPHTGVVEMEALKRWIQENIPDARVDNKAYGGQLRFSVLAAGSSPGEVEVTGRRSIGKLFSVLERNKRALGIGYYSVGRTTLDEVFVSLMRKHGGEEENS